MVDSLALDTYGGAEELTDQIDSGPGGSQYPGGRDGRQFTPNDLRQLPGKG